MLPSRHGPQLKSQVIKWVRPRSPIIFTDEWSAYNGLERHFLDHSRVRRSVGESRGSEMPAPNTVEGFFGHIKTSIRGTYKKVSHTYLQGYLNEFVWRRNARLGERAMFEQLLRRAA